MTLRVGRGSAPDTSLLKFTAYSNSSSVVGYCPRYEGQGV